MVKVFFVLFFLASCTSYRFSHQDNPLAHFEIKSLSVPMFYNYSNLGNTSSEFTREVYRLLSRFSGLKLVSGYSQDTDAVLFGIIKSDEKLAQGQVTKNLRVAQDTAPNSIGNSRQSFYIPGTSEINLVLHVVVIKKPTALELELLKTSMGDKIELSSKVIFNQKIPIRTQFNREILDNTGTQVIATQNAGVIRKSTKTMAENAAIAVRDMILYAF